jgi:hypothetical protein
VFDREQPAPGRPSCRLPDEPPPNCYAEEPPLLAVAGVDHVAACHDAEELAGRWPPRGVRDRRDRQPGHRAARPARHPWTRSRPRLTSRTAAPQADPGGHPARPPCSWARRPRGRSSSRARSWWARPASRCGASAATSERQPRCCRRCRSSAPQAGAPAAPHRARGRRPQPGTPPSSCRFRIPLLEGPGHLRRAGAGPGRPGQGHPVACHFAEPHGLLWRRAGPRRPAARVSANSRSPHPEALRKFSAMGSRRRPVAQCAD